MFIFPLHPVLIHRGGTFVLGIRGVVHSAGRCPELFLIEAH
jgi:hypothetical protein